MEKIIKITFPDDFKFGNVGGERCEECPICRIDYENNLHCGLSKYAFNATCPFISSGTFANGVEEIRSCKDNKNCKNCVHGRYVEDKSVYYCSKNKIYMG